MSPTPEYSAIMPGRSKLTEGEVAFRQHKSGHTPGLNWPTFLSFADRYIQGPASASVPKDAK